MAGAHESRWHCIFPGMFSFGVTQKQFDLESDKGIPSPRDLFSWQQFWLEIYLLAQKEKNSNSVKTVQSNWSALSE